MNTKLNIETRISNRLQSIFAAFGQIINDFYLEAGIYFVGGFNAALVAWDIYTNLLIDNQPLPYAIAIAIISFIAVEGLAVYLVGAAAKTNNKSLWFFSMVFAAFFTYAHYKEMGSHTISIAWYITLAVPSFVVVGYWARTVKADIEASQLDTIQQRQAEAARQQKIEGEERRRKRDIEDKKLDHQMALDRLKVEGQNEVKRLKIEVQKSAQEVQKSTKMNQMDRQNGQIEPANGARKNKKMNRQNDLVELVKMNPDLKPTELMKRLNKMGHSTSISTVKRDIKALNGHLASS
jgi:hypothetical protein